MIAYFDIETTSRKADSGMVIAIGLLKDEEPEVKFVETPDEERKALEWLRGELSGCRQLVTWYGSGFDVPFLLARAALLNVDLRVLAEIPMLDLCEWSRGHMLLSSYRLESVARFFGIQRDLEFHGGDVLTLFKLVKRGDYEARRLIIDHCKDDLRLLKRVHERIRPQVGR
jgi:uncharacterized protein YprB with RNaseH-like and TPR domain